MFKSSFFLLRLFASNPAGSATLERIHLPPIFLRGFIHPTTSRQFLPNLRWHLRGARSYTCRPA